MKENNTTERKFSAFCYYVFSWMLIGTLYTLVKEYAITSSIEVFKILFTLQLTLLIGLSHGIYDLMILKHSTNTQPAAITIIKRSFYFVMEICMNFILCSLLFSLHDGVKEIINEESIRNTINALKEPDNQSLIIMFFVFGHLITFFRNASRNFGLTKIIDTFAGKRFN